MKTLCTLFLTLAASSAALATPSSSAALATPSDPSTSSTCAPGALGAARFLSAADYRQEFVPADATMVLHVDLKNLRNSTLGQVITKMRPEFEDDEMKEMIAKLGFDPLTEIDAITIYGSGQDEENFGAVLVASEAIDKALEMLPEQEGYQAVSKDGIDFFQFDGLVGSWHIMDSGERLVMVGKTIDIALRGHQVIHGDLPNQSQHKHASKGGPTPGSIVYFSGGGELLKQAKGQIGSSIMEAVTGGQFEMSESDGYLKLSLGVQTGSREAAQDMRETLGGFMALGRMLISNSDQIPAEAAGLLRSINLNVEGKNVAISLSVPVKDAMQIMHSIER